MTRGARNAAIVGLVGLAACAVGAFVDREALFQAWLVTWLFLFGLSLAAMAQRYLHDITGGEWGLVLRPALEAIAQALPVVAILVLPLAFGLRDLFAWARPEDVAASDLLQAKSWYLNVPAFAARNAAWLLVWGALALAVRRVRNRRLAVAGLLLYLVTVTFVAVDWVASLVPDWYSTAVGIRLGAAQFAAAFAATIAVGGGGRPPATARDRQDFGNLLLTFSMTWGYFVFAQYLVVWGADLPHETSWFLPRVQTTWRFLGIAVIATMFAVPTVLMLFRPVKRNALALRIVCTVVLAGAWLDTAWLVLPSLRPSGTSFHWIDGAALIGQGGLWLATVMTLARRGSIPAPTRTELVHG
jgi:hypothetical protein